MNMKCLVFSKKVFIPLVAALIVAFPVFSPSAYPGGTFSFNPQGPISPRGELAVVHKEPSVAMDSQGNSYAIWTDYRNGNPSDIYFSYRPKDGAWQGNVKVNDDSRAAHDSPAITVDSNGNAYAVWIEYRDENQDIYSAYRPLGGTWQANTKVNHDTGTAGRRSPSIAADANGNAYAVWADTRDGQDVIFFSYRPAGGTWQAEGKVNQDSGTASHYHPRIASAPNGHVMVVWEDTRNGHSDIYSANKPLGGSWTEVKVNSDVGGADHYSPDVAFINNINLFGILFGTFIAVWEDYRIDSPGIYSAIDVLDNWALVQGKIDDDSGLRSKSNPRIATDNAGNAYAVWEDRREGGNYRDIYFSFRTAGISDPWQPNKKINDDGQPLVDRSFPCIAVDPVSGNASSLWVDDTNISNNIFSASRPAGGNWGGNLKVNDDLSGQRIQYTPVAALDPNGNAFAFWAEERADLRDIYSSFRPRGGSWQAAVRVNDVLGRAISSPVAATMDSAGNAYAVWGDIRNGSEWDLYFSFRPWGGTWLANERVSPKLMYPSSPALIVDQKGNAYAAWNGLQIGKHDVHFAVRPAGGTWQAPEKVNDVNDVASTASLAVGPTGTVYALWEDCRNGNADIYFSYRPPGGTWHPNEKIDNDSGGAAQTQPKIAVDGQENIYALWADYRNGNADIYFSYRPAGGSWQGKTIVNRATTAIHTAPALAVNAKGEGYAVWEDYRNGITDFYFSNRPAGGTWSTEMKVNGDQGISQQNSPALSLAVNDHGTVLVTWDSNKWGYGSAFYALANEHNYIYLPLVVRP